VLADAGLPVALRTLQQWEIQWEIGQHAPNPVTAAALERFLTEQEKQSAIQINPIVTPVIQRLKRWREEKNLSTAQAGAALKESGLPVKANTLQRWQSGLRHPSALTANAIANFLDRVHVTDEQQRLYWRLKELQKELAAARRIVGEKPERDVVQIVDELMQVVEDLLKISTKGHFRAEEINTNIARHTHFERQGALSTPKKVIGFEDHPTLLCHAESDAAAIKLIRQNS
jgi:transcriptional regulator with XRE-family HTH domain